MKLKAMARKCLWDICDNYCPISNSWRGRWVFKVSAKLLDWVCSDKYWVNSLDYKAMDS